MQGGGGLCVWHALCCVAASPHAKPGCVHPCLSQKEKWMKIAVASSTHRLRHRIPTVDIDANPFCQDRQLRDEVEKYVINKNPRYFLGSLDGGGSRRRSKSDAAQVGEMVALWW